jgi:hypothetical protein
LGKDWANGTPMKSLNSISNVPKNEKKIGEEDITEKERKLKLNGFPII